MMLAPVLYPWGNNDNTNVGSRGDRNRSMFLAMIMMRRGWSHSSIINQPGVLWASVVIHGPPWVILVSLSSFSAFIPHLFVSRFFPCIPNFFL